MSNVAVHMLAEGVPYAVFAQVGRLVRESRLLAFQVNSLEYRSLRALKPLAREPGPDYVAEEPGRSMHFCSEAYLRELLAG
jgi:hypothetical protein